VTAKFGDDGREYLIKLLYDASESLNRLVAGCTREGIEIRPHWIAYLDTLDRTMLTLSRVGTREAVTVERSEEIMNTGLAIANEIAAVLEKKKRRGSA
jgi:hypothetical protein